MRAEAFEDLLKGHGGVFGLLASRRESARKRFLCARADTLLPGAGRVLKEQCIDASPQGHDFGLDRFVQIHRFGSFGGVAIPKVAARAGIVLAAIVPLASVAPAPAAGAAA